MDLSDRQSHSSRAVARRSRNRRTCGGASVRRPSDGVPEVTRAFSQAPERMSETSGPIPGIAGSRTAPLTAGPGPAITEPGWFGTVLALEGQGAFVLKTGRKMASAGVAEPVDARVSKTRSFWECEFESHRPHHLRPTGPPPGAGFAKVRSPFSPNVNTRNPRDLCLTAEAYSRARADAQPGRYATRHTLIEKKVLKRRLY